MTVRALGLCQPAARVSCTSARPLLNAASLTMRGRIPFAGSCEKSLGLRILLCVVPCA